jgi:hypothetical protein
MSSGRLIDKYDYDATNLCIRLEQNITGYNYRTGKSTIPEANLFIAIIKQAIFDTTLIFKKHKRNTELIKNVFSAYSFLLQKQRILHYLDAIGISYEYFHKEINAYINKLFGKDMSLQEINKLIRTKYDLSNYDYIKLR